MIQPSLMLALFRFQPMAGALIGLALARVRVWLGIGLYC